MASQSTKIIYMLRVENQIIYAASKTCGPYCLVLDIMWVPFASHSQGRLVGWCCNHGRGFGAGNAVGDENHKGNKSVQLVVVSKQSWSA